jgi:hypothetical protein
MENTFAADRFDVPSSTGWATAVIGGTWNTESPLAWFTATDGNGRILLGTPGVGAGAFLSTGERDNDVTVTMSVTGTPTGGGAYLSLVGRRIGTTDHRVKVRYTAAGGLELYLTRASGVSRSDGVEVDLASLIVARSGWDPARPLRVRLQVTGASPTTLRAKVWPADTVEPFGWQLVATEASPDMQGPGGVGLVGYLSSSASSSITATFDDLEARRVSPNGS